MVLYKSLAEKEIFSKLMKANWCKTMSSKVFYFSVQDQKIADSLMKLVGKEMRLHYVQYPSSLPWRGDNYDDANTAQNAESDKGQSIVDRIEEVRLDMYAPQGYYPPQAPQPAPQQAQATAPQQAAPATTAAPQQTTPAAAPATTTSAPSTTIVTTSSSTSATSTTTPQAPTPQPAAAPAAK
jgi:hypothetical protein